jgi:hypothetical protein
MNKTTWSVLITVVIVLIVGAGIYFQSLQSAAPTTTPTTPTSTISSTVDPLNATYNVENQPVTLTNGSSTMSIPAPKASTDTTMNTNIVTAIFGQPVSGDLNGDGSQDAAMLLVQNTGGSGTFYYVAAAIVTVNGTQGTNAIFLGDRIAPQNIAIQNGEIVVNYADRKANQSFAVAPSVGITKYFTVNGFDLQESNSATGTAPSPSSSTVPIAGPGERCGGNMMNAPICGTGYHCTPTPGSNLPFGDVGGTCVKN